jgi:hypothetical protein
MAVKSIAVSDDVTIPPGTSGCVVESSVLGRPRRVRFVLHNGAGEREVIADVGRGDVV